MRFTQPQAGPALIDWANPITRGLIFAQNGDSQLDLVTGKKVFGSTGVTTSVVGFRGRARGHANSADFYAGNDAADTALSFGMFALADIPIGGFTPFSGVLAHTTDLTVAPGWAAFQQDEGGDLSIYSAAELPRKVCGDPSDLEGKGTISLGGGYEEGLFAGYIGGKLVGSQNLVDPPNTGVGLIKVAGSRDVVGLTATIYLVLIWSRLPSAGEYDSLNANPWQLFQLPRRIWMPPALVADTPGLLVTDRGEAIAWAQQDTHAAIVLANAMAEMPVVNLGDQNFELASGYDNDTALELGVWAAQVGVFEAIAGNVPWVASEDASSGATYPVDAADTASATDTAAANLSLSTASSEVATAADSATVSGTSAPAAADAAAPADSAALAGTLGAAGVDAVTPADSGSQAATLACTATDAASAIDSAATRWVVGAAAVDAAAAGDAAIADTGSSVSAADSIGAADAAATTGAFSATSTEAVTAADASTITLVAIAVASDAAAAADASGASAVLQSAAADAIAPADATACSAFAARSATDATAATDAASAINAVASAATDTITAADAATGSRIAVGLAFDSVALVDQAVTTGSVFNCSAADGVALSDLAAAQAIFNCAAADAIVVVDAAIAAAIKAVSASDAISLSDFASGSEGMLGFDSQIWRYEVAPDDLRFAVSADDLRYAVDIGSLSFNSTR